MRLRCYYYAQAIPALFRLKANHKAIYHHVSNRLLYCYVDVRLSKHHEYDLEYVIICTK